MNKRLSAILSTAISTGILAAQAARAEEAKPQPTATEVTPNKNGCQNKDKNSCKHHDQAKKDAKDKNSCKNTCAPAAEAKEKK